MVAEDVNIFWVMTERGLSKADKNDLRLENGTKSFNL